MILELRLDSQVKRSAVIVLALIVNLSLVFVVTSHFIVGVIADQRADLAPDVAASAVAYFPHSARVQSRWAEACLAGAVEDEGTIRQAESAAATAVGYSPWDYRLRLLLASAKEASGNLAAAEESLQVARSLAPHNANVQWLLANLLVREGKFSQALDKFAASVASDPSRLVAALDLIWNASGGDLNALTVVTGSEPTLRLELANYLLKKPLVDDAARVFSEIDPRARIALPGSTAFINTLMAAGRFELARNFWVEMVGDRSNAGRPLLWNGGFESQIRKGWDQFDWSLSNSSYVQVSVTTDTARSGGSSLKVAFTGRDTTELYNEIKQLILVRPGARYRLECYAKAENLVISEGPRVAVTGYASPAPIAVSEPVAVGSHDWQVLAIDFVAPAASSAMLVTVRRIPNFSYDDPARGTIWFDDFILRER